MEYVIGNGKADIRFPEGLLVPIVSSISNTTVASFLLPSSQREVGCDLQKFREALEVAEKGWDVIEGGKLSKRKRSVSKGAQVRDSSRE